MALDEAYDWVHLGVESWRDFELLREIEKTFIKEAGQAAGKRLLELGCGYGRSSLRFSEAGFDVVGLDTNQEAVNKFNRFAKEKGLVAIANCADVTEYDVDLADWDAIVCEYVIHSMRGQQGLNMLNRIQTATRVGGLNLVAVFTSSGEAFKGDSVHCYPEPGYLRAIYERPGWKILHYQEDITTTKKGPSQVASQIIARKLQ